MTQEDKHLLLVDLCARLPYAVKYKTYLGDVFTLKDITFSKTTTEYYIDDNAFSTSQIKPYLRPMSSMTEDEKETYQMLFNEDGLLNTSIDIYLDWLLEGHFDFRGLISRGLAVEAPEGMYNT